MPFDATHQAVGVHINLFQEERRGITGADAMLIFSFALRKALCALLDTGIPATTQGALELVSCLGRELDRRWCLSFLARRGDLRGALLDRALGLVDSDFSKRRLTAISG